MDAHHNYRRGKKQRDHEREQFRFNQMDIDEKYGNINQNKNCNIIF